MNTAKSLILMATYNGEKYLDRQLQSIVSQSDPDWHLLIRDDGSKDGTIEIIRKYLSDDRIELIVNDSDRHGAYRNFFSLIENAKKREAYDYYFFADQDDEWLPDKLDVMTSAMKESEFANSPLLAYSDMRVINQDDEVIHESLHQVMGIGDIGKNSGSPFGIFYAHGFLWGCDTAFNRQLFEKLIPLDDRNEYINIVSHDNYVGKFATAFGHIEFVDRPCMNYRRHGDNTTGAYSMKLNPVKILKRGLLQLNDLARVHARVYTQSLIAIEQIKCAEDYAPAIDDIELSLKTGGIKGVKILRKYHIKRKQKARTFAIYFIMLFGLYKKWMWEKQLEK